MIESRVLLQSDTQNAEKLLILGTEFKDKFVYTSITIARYSPELSCLSPEMEAKRRAFQDFSGCATKGDYYESVVEKLVAAPITIYTALQRAKKDSAVLFMAASTEIMQALMVSLKVRP